jgi:hypothetical protein
MLGRQAHDAEFLIYHFFTSGGSSWPPAVGFFYEVAGRNLDLFRYADDAIELGAFSERTAFLGSVANDRSWPLAAAPACDCRGRFRGESRQSDVIEPRPLSPRKRTCSKQRSKLYLFPRAGRHPLAPRIAELIRVSLRCPCSRAFPHPPRPDWKGSGRVPSFGAEYLLSRHSMPSMLGSAEAD